MKEVTLNGKVYKLYNDVHELPVVNFQRYNKYVLFESHIGSDIDAVDRHLGTLAKLIKTDIKKAQVEINNLRANLYYIANNISPSMLAFATLIYSIDGVVNKDLSDENLKKIIKDLEPVKRSVIRELFEQFKKKLDFELRTYFPKLFNDVKSLKYYTARKQSAELMLKAILEDKDTEEELSAIEEYLFNLYSPKSFDGPDSLEVKLDKQFAQACVLISQKSGLEPLGLSLFNYYSALEAIDAQLEAERKAYKKIKH